MPSADDDAPVPERAWIALGSNLGDRAAHLARARAGLAAQPGTRVVAASSVEETAPLAGMDQPPYLNQMVLVETVLEPHALLEVLHRLEAEAGRIRDARWGPRTLDLDIVRYGDRVIVDAVLTVPHPELSRRDFWQRELAELAVHER